MAIVKASSLQFKVSDNFFKKLNAQAEKIANQESQQMAIDMHFILKNRFKFKGEPNSRWPKYDLRKPTTGGQASHKGWRIQKRKNGEYWLANHSLSSNEEVAYSQILATGHGWSTKVLLGNWTRLTGTPTGGLFSTQMPNGLSPWINVKRGDMEEKILARMKKEL